MRAALPQVRGAALRVRAAAVQFRGLVCSMLEVQFAACFEERCLKFAALLLEFAPRAVEFRGSVYDMLEV